jgi:hypothetical protein
MRKIFRPKRDDITEEWRKLHNEERSDLYLSHNIVRVIKWRRIRWVWHIACMGERRDAYRVLVGKPEGRDHLEEPGVDGRIILIWIFMKWDVGAWTGSFWLRIRTGSGHL